MRKVLVFLLLLLNRSGAFASQGPADAPSNRIIVHAKAENLNRNFLRLCGQEYINACQAYNINTQLGDLCFPIYYTTPDERANLRERLFNLGPVQSQQQYMKDIQTTENKGLSTAFNELNNIHYLPLKILLNEDSTAFKKPDTVLFQFSRFIDQKEYVFEVRLVADLTHFNLNFLIDKFKQDILCSQGIWDKELNLYDLGKEAKQELITAGYLVKNNKGALAFGPKMNISQLPQKIQSTNQEPKSSWRSFIMPTIFLGALLAGSLLFIQYLRSGKTAY